MEREMEREGGLEQSKVERGAAVWGEMVRRDGEERTEGREGEKYEGATNEILLPYFHLKHRCGNESVKCREDKETQATETI